jgi:hypothetical protein
MKVFLKESWWIDNKLYLKGDTVEISEALYQSAIKDGIKIELVKTKLEIKEAKKTNADDKI